MAALAVYRATPGPAVAATLPPQELTEEVRGRTPLLPAWPSHRHLLAPHRHDTEPDMVGTPLRLEPLPEGRTGSPGVVGPRAAPARPGIGAVPVLFRGG